MPSTKTRSDDDTYIPFAARFKAWWHGAEPVALVQGPGDSGPDPERAAIHTDEQADPSGWSPARRAFCQRLWGPGFIEPGGPEFTLHLLKPCALGPEHTVLDLTTGMAGGAQTGSDAFGIWVDAVDPDPDLAKAAQQRCIDKGYGKRVTVSDIDPQSLSLKKNRYDCIFVRERFRGFENKPKALQTIRKALKPRGQLVLTDLVQGEAGPGSHTKKWFALTDDDSDLLTADDYRDLIAKTKLEVMIFETDPTDFRNYILNGWAEFVDRLEREEMTRDFVDLLMVEAEKWLALTRAIEAKEISYLRIHAIRPKFAKK